MTSTRPNEEEETSARTALLDAAERLMLSDGYAAVTSPDGSGRRPG